MKFYAILWAGLLGIVVVEVLVTYSGLRPMALTLSLLSLALIEAGVALMYFMHLKFERRILGILFASTLILGAILVSVGIAELVLPRP